jgi:hypothetical protein
MYPFRPKSTARLKPGQYWSFQLNGGKFVSGVVLALRLKNGKIDRRSFLAGLLDWSGNALPNADELEGREIKECGFAHIKTITENGGDVLGEIGPCWGYPAVIERTDFPKIHGWGFGVIRVYGEKYFVRRAD